MISRWPRKAVCIAKRLEISCHGSTTRHVPTEVLGAGYLLVVEVVSR
jgi:hypothetical protein